MMGQMGGADGMDEGNIPNLGNLDDLLKNK